MGDFIDAGAVLGSGVYVLRNYGRVVFVGKAKCIAAKVYGHMAKKQSQVELFFRRMEFDGVEIRKCRVDQLDEVWCDVCLELGWSAPNSVTQLRAVEEATAKMRRRA
jgi:hypothetical protein